MHNYKNLSVWNKSTVFAKSIIQLTDQLPKEHRFELSSQLIRAAISIPSNIAEGSSRDSNKAFKVFLSYSLGSAFEIETQLSIVRMLKFGDETWTRELLIECKDIQRMIYALRKSLKT